MYSVDEHSKTRLNQMRSHGFDYDLFESNVECTNEIAYAERQGSVRIHDSSVELEFS